MLIYMERIQQNIAIFGMKLEEYTAAITAPGNSENLLFGQNGEGTSKQCMSPIKIRR